MLDRYSKVYISMPRDFLDQLDQVAREEHLSRSAIIRESVKLFMEWRAASPAACFLAMKEALRNIQTGQYAKRFIQEGQNNYPEMTARRRLMAAHPIEQVGERLRSMMPWITANKLVDKSKN